MASTTIKLSIETRDRLKSFGGDTYEDTIIEALDALDEERFWAQAAEAQARYEALPEEVRARIAARDMELQSLLDGLS